MANGHFARRTDTAGSFHLADCLGRCGKGDSGGIDCWALIILKSDKLISKPHRKWI
jgi:hypothetical protein